MPRFECFERTCTAYSVLIPIVSLVLLVSSACSDSDPDRASVVAIQSDDATAVDAPATPVAPRRIVAIEQDFRGIRPQSWSGTQTGFNEFEFPLIFNQDLDGLRSTDWGNDFYFGNSHVSLPENHAQAAEASLQGGTLALRHRADGRSQAIVRMAWATDMRPYNDATCESSLAMWYTDDPEQTPIASLDSIDASREVDGNPYMACSLAVTLTASTIYKLQLNELLDARESEAPEWWRASFVDTLSNEEIIIADIELPGAWNWLEPRTTAYVDHFATLVGGCAATPGSNTRFFAARADQARYTATPSATLDGPCESSNRERTTLVCDDAGCDVLVQ